MYRIIDGEPVEHVRHGEDILPADHPLVREVIGQLVLFETIEETQ